MDAHNICLDIQEAVRCRLRPGEIPSKIFEDVYLTEVVPRNFEEHFMGFGSNQVSFLGHGIGLVIDEFPAIAGKIDFPLKKNMVIAVEPKKGLEGIGLVGVENTFLVTEQGGEKLTPGSDEILMRYWSFPRRLVMEFVFFLAENLLPSKTEAQSSRLKAERKGR